MKGTGEADALVAHSPQTIDEDGREAIEIGRAHLIDDDEDDEARRRLSFDRAQ
jgi:hypothetical protein